MARQDRAERLRQAIVEAAARLEATAQEPARASGGPAPGDLYVFETPVEAAIEWLVVRFHVDDPAIVLLAPADDLPLAGQCDVGLWPEFLDRPLTVRCGESAWLPATMCADYLRVGMVPEEAAAEVRRVIAGLARGNMPNDPVRECAEADPEYMAWLDEVARARQALADRGKPQPPTGEGPVLQLDELGRAPPSWLVAVEPDLALAASAGAGLTADRRESRAPASLRWAEVPLRTGGALVLAADAGGVRVGWRGAKDVAPPQLTGFGSAGKQVAVWTNGERPDFHRAEPDFVWLDGQVILQAGNGNPQTVTVRL
ncbi:MAG TPA: hypothetical protein VNH11_24820 [Pirellulales bacterium]|nr:hypothetical protein [Pirellulales bacterium]